MTFQGDPYRTLGIVVGASLNEIRSAYRRLAKQYHPDAAGDRALPRFLAIQAAYERLVDSEGRLRPVGGAGSATRKGTESWRADATRARASREAWRARRAGATSTGGAPGPAGTASKAKPGTGGTGGPGGRGSATGAGGAGGAGEAPPRERHTRRASRKATPGSTTYDEAKETPLDPEWEGGAWYGPSSNTYWTINPREYADPRKHGPEYQARARRASQERGADGDGGPADHRRLPARPPPPSRAGPGAAASPRPPMAAMRAGARTAGNTRRRIETPGSEPRRARAGRSAAGPADGITRPTPSRCRTSRPWRARRRRATCSRSPVGRAGAGGWSIALIAWPPVGYGVGHADLDHDRLRPVRHHVRRAVAAGAARGAAADRGGAVRGPARRGRRGVRRDRRAGCRRAGRGRAVGEWRPRVAGRCRAPRRVRHDRVLRRHGRRSDRGVAPAAAHDEDAGAAPGSGSSAA